MLHQGKFAAGLVNGEHHYAVVPAVRAVHKPAVFRNVHIGAEAFAGEARRERGNGFYLGERARGGVVGEGREGGVELTDHVGKALVGVEGEVARSGPRLGRERGLRLALQFAIGFVQFVADDLVYAQIYRQGEVVFGIWYNAVGVRRFLLFSGAASFVLIRISGRAQLPVGLNPERRDVPAGIIGHQRYLLGMIQTDIAGGAAQGRLLVQEGEVAGALIYGKRTYPAAFLPLELGGLVHGV